MSEPLAKRRRVKEPKKTSRDHPERTITDPRFANIQSDPRYRLPSKGQTNVKLDKRFSRILKDDDFSRKAPVDRYGRPIEIDSEKRRLKRRYEIEDDEDEDGVEKVRDPLREGIVSGSSSDESSSDEGEDEDEVVDEGGFAEHLDGAVPMGDVSSRIAVVNLDWDNIRSEDLMAVFSSFLPATGRLLKVSIYPSEFGRERMEREEMEGPPSEIFATKDVPDEFEPDSDGEDEDDDENIKKSIMKPGEGEEFNAAKLRQYQLERLRYFYAVLTFSSSSAAKAIYDAVDGTEYLSTANFFDLRFIPAETDFSSDKPREECERIPDGYKPNEFVTDALQHSKVKLTWDAEDVSRKEAQARAFRGSRQEIDENDLKAYLGSDTSDDEEDPAAAASAKAEAGPALSKKEKERQKMRALLGLGAEPVKKSKKDDGPVGDLQVTFSSGLSGTADGTKPSVFENEPEVEETTVAKYVRKERERKQKRKERLKQPKDGEEAETADQPQDLGFDDPFFEGGLEQPSKSKKSKEERLAKRAAREAEEAANASKRAELELLMAPDNDRDTQVRHFDMNEIEKAERRARKKGKYAKKAAVEGDDFKMDTADPRFAKRLFENHEFAIDPMNARFKGTKAMKALLEEGRKRRGKAEN